MDQLRNLVAAIQHEQDVLVNGHEGMAAVEVARRAYTGQPAEPLFGIHHRRYSPQWAFAPTRGPGGNL